MKPINSRSLRNLHNLAHRDRERVLAQAGTICLRAYILETKERADVLEAERQRLMATRQMALVTLSARENDPEAARLAALEN